MSDRVKVADKINLEHNLRVQLENLDLLISVWRQCGVVIILAILFGSTFTFTLPLPYLYRHYADYLSANKVITIIIK